MRLAAASWLVYRGRDHDTSDRVAGLPSQQARSVAFVPGSGGGVWAVPGPRRRLNARGSELHLEVQRRYL
jgi:hypothetical protein